MENTDIEILIEKISSLIENLDTYVASLSNQSISWIEIGTLGVALLAVAATFVSIYGTIKCDKKNREANENIARQLQASEDKRAEAAIDANLTASARIEWIERVRQATAELITACYRYIESKEIEQINKNLETVQEKKSLFVLYFGPDNDGSNEVMACDLYDKKTNKGKNDKIVLFVDDLYNEMVSYHFNRISADRCRKELAKCSECEYMNNEGERESYLCQKDEYTYYNKEDCERMKREQSEGLECYNKNMLFASTHIQNLSEIMRIYGKLNGIGQNRESKDKFSVTARN